MLNNDFKAFMLSDSQQTIIKGICRTKGLGKVNFQDNGLIHFQNTQPIKEEVLKTFPAFEVVNFGESPVYWITLRPDCE